LIGFRSYGGVDGDGRRPMSGPAAGTGGNGGGGRPPASRIGFRTRSEVDVLDDGFKWRKYGKKAVKSSPNPRYSTIQYDSGDHFSSIPWSRSCMHA